METITRAIGKTARLMVMVDTPILMAPSTKAAGSRISSQAKEGKFGQTELFLKANILMARRMDTANSSGLTAAATRADLNIT